MLKSKLKRSMAILSPTAGVAVLAQPRYGGCALGRCGGHRAQCPDCLDDRSPSVTATGRWRRRRCLRLRRRELLRLDRRPAPERPDRCHRSHADGHGYWEVGGDGGVFAFGDAAFYGSTGGQHLNAPIVAIAPTPDATATGRWPRRRCLRLRRRELLRLATGLHPNASIVAIAATSDGRGYWVASSDGGVFAYGDANFYGSQLLSA